MVVLAVEGIGRWRHIGLFLLGIENEYDDKRKRQQRACYRN